MISKFVIFIILMHIASLACAQTSQESRFKHADINKDKVADKKEKKVESEWERGRRLEENISWEKGADLNKDGVVDGNEVRLWREKIDVDGDKVVDAGEKRLAELREESKVNTVIERKYDLNSDGELDAVEKAELFRDKQAIIASEGKARVDTYQEQLYDINRDGLIDSQEAASWKEDIESKQ